MREIAFELKDVNYSYLGKYPALCGINMTIRAGEKMAVIGANGTGKSTLLHLLGIMEVMVVMDGTYLQIRVVEVVELI